MPEKIKFVIIGSGNIAQTYLTAISHIPQAEVVGIVSRKKASETVHQLPLFTTLQEIDVDYDAVIVCTPNGLHHVATIEAATLGKHVLCEKPLDISVNNMDKMIATCKQQHVKLGVAYQRRHSSDNPLIKQLIDEQQLGTIFSVDLSVKNYRDANYYNSSSYRGTYSIDGGGPFMQQASHYIDLYYWFFGKPTQIVSKLGTFVHAIEVEDHGAAICVHESGMIGTITASTATKPGFPAKMEIYSNKGYLVVENDVITHWDIEGVKNPSQQTANTHSGSSSAVVNDTSNHERIITDFIEAVQTDREPLINGASAKNATEIILAIYNK